MIVCKVITVLRRYAISLLVLLTVLLFVDCSASSSFSSHDMKRSKIVATTFGSTDPVKRFPIGGTKPHSHIIWGDDVEDGAQCSIIIFSALAAQEVYRRDFVYQLETVGNGFNYFRSRIVELDPKWNFKYGKFFMILTINGKRVSTFTFSTVPSKSSDFNT